MKRIIFAMALLCASLSANAQHSLQVDDGAGNIGILTAPTSGGLTMFTLPSSGGMLITTGTTATNPWLLQGNSLSALGASPTQWFGTSTNDDVIMKANGVEKLRLVSGGGVVIPGNALSINGVAYTFPAAAPNGVLTNTAGVLTWEAAGGLVHFTESVNIAAPNATVPVVQLLATNAATDVDVALSPKGTGALLAHVPNNLVSGGNKRGQYAVDWQMSRALNTQVASGNYATISGGSENTASTSWSTIGGGNDNSITLGVSSTIGGGASNTITALSAVISGGISNTASGIYSTIGGGNTNLANATSSTIGGGKDNQATGFTSTISGGETNFATLNYTTVGGGLANSANADYATVGGGTGNTINGSYSTIAGGQSNGAHGLRSTVGGGNSNSVSDDYGTVGGGQANQAGNNSAPSTDRTFATVGGGFGNIASGQYSIVGGGEENNASGTHSSIVGGSDNVTSGLGSTVSGGLLNTTQGDYSAILGGRGLILDATADGSVGYLGNNAGSNDMTISAPNTAVFGNTNLWLANNNSTPSSLFFYEAESGTGAFPSSTKSVSFKSPATLTATQAYTLPLDYPSVSGYVLSSTTGGVMSWVVAGGGLSGGTSNAITKWTSATTIGNSSMTDNGTSVGIGSNVSVDLASGNLNVVGEYQRGGSRILDNPGTNNLRVGKLAGHNNTGGSNTYVGSSAGAGVSSGSDNVYLGFNAGVQTAPASSSNNVMLGSNVGTFSNGSSNNTFIGYGAAVLHTSGDGNTFLGTNVGAVSTTESNNTLIGGSSEMAASITRATAIGHRAYVGVSDALVLGSISGVNGSASDALVGIGTASPTEKLEVKSGNILLSNAGTAGTLGFQGTSTGVSTFKAGAQGATTINYTLPTTQPSAGQTLTATAVTGSGPYAVTTGWSTPSSYAKVKSATEGVTSNATMQDDDDIVGVAIGASERWSFEGIFIVNSASATPDVKWQWVASQTVSSMDYLLESVEPGSVNVADVLVSSDASFTTSTSRNVGLTAGVDKIVKIKGSFVWGATTGTLKLQWAQNASNASTTNLKRGSYINFTKHQ